MNHHLRFVGPAALAAGVILSLSSCSSTKVEPLVANPKHEITYEVRIFDLPVDSETTAGIRVLSSEDGASLVQNLESTPPFQGSLGGRSGEKKTLSNKKDFRYPTAYDPPQFTKPDGREIFPVTPATPRDFVTTQIGTTVSLAGSKLTNGTYKLHTKLDRKILLGFINYGKPITADATDWLGRKVDVIITENRMEQPRFSSHRKDTTATLQKGQYLVITEPGNLKAEQIKMNYPQKRPPGFIAMIRAIHR